MILPGKGNNGAPPEGALKNLFEMQKGFQKNITGIVTPSDNVMWFAYHIAAMVEELGEVLKADKRWKTHRNVRYDRNEKKDEIADMFITAMNIALFSGLDWDDVYLAVANKILQNLEKLKLEGQNESNRT